MSKINKESAQILTIFFIAVIENSFKEFYQDLWVPIYALSLQDAKVVWICIGMLSLNFLILIDEESMQIWVKRDSYQ